MKEDKSLKCVFVDYFDTIVYRKIYPNKTKEIWSQRMSREMNYSVKPIRLLQYRLMLEDILARNSKCGNFKYVDLCKHIARNIVKSYDVNFEEWFYEKSKSVEETIELENQIINEKIINRLWEYKKQGKKIFLISEFYLGEDSYKKFFEKLNISNLFDRIYISCDYLASKSDGRLFKYALSENNIAPEETLMIGDNFKSDYKIPISLGMRAVHYENKKQIKHYKKQLHSTTEQKLKKISSRSKMMDNYAFSLYLFCDKLYIKCIQQNIKDIYFLAREGLFIKKLFDEYVKSHHYSINTHYTYVSRKSTYIASLQGLETENFSALFRESSKFNCYTFMKALNFTSDEIKLVGYKENFDVNENFKESNEFKELKRNKEFAKIYEAKRQEQNRNFKRHMASMGYDGRSKLYVVDVGWKGFIQDNIYDIYEKQVEVSGYYLGYDNFGKISLTNRKQGLLFDTVTFSDEINCDIFIYDALNYELILAAGHGKTVGYQEDGTPVLEYDEDKIAYDKYVKKIQELLLNKFIKIGEIFDDFIVDEPTQKVFENMHEKLLAKMSLKDTYLLYKLYALHRDSFLGQDGRMRDFIPFLIRKKAKSIIKLKEYTGKKYGVKK